MVLALNLFRRIFQFLGQFYHVWKPFKQDLKILRFFENPGVTHSISANFFFAFKLLDLKGKSNVQDFNSSFEIYSVQKSLNLNIKFINFGSKKANVTTVTSKHFIKQCAKTSKLPEGCFFKNYVPSVILTCICFATFIIKSFETVLNNLLFLQ